MSRIRESMQEALAIARDEMPKTEFRVHIPASVDVKNIRQQMRLSQEAFAAQYGLSLHTLRNWEQGKRQPDPAARAYLKVIEKAPDTVRAVLAQ